MDPIHREVRASALRDLFLAVLAALALMFHFAAAPMAGLKAGAIGFTFVALLMVVRIIRADRQDVREGEVWNNLPVDERPPPTIASSRVRTAERQVSGRYGWYASGVSLVLWTLTIGGNLMTVWI